MEILVLWQLSLAWDSPINVSQTYEREHPPSPHPSTATHDILICYHQHPTAALCFRILIHGFLDPLRRGGGGWCRSLKRALPLHHEKCTPYVTRWSSLTAKTLFVELQIWIIYDEDSGAGRGETENKGIVKTRNAWENTAKKDYRWRNKWRQKETNFHE